MLVLERCVKFPLHGRTWNSQAPEHRARRTQEDFQQHMRQLEFFSCGSILYAVEMKDFGNLFEERLTYLLRRVDTRDKEYER